MANQTDVRPRPLVKTIAMALISRVCLPGPLSGRGSTCCCCDLLFCLRTIFWPSTTVFFATSTTRNYTNRQSRTRHKDSFGPRCCSTLSLLIAKSRMRRVREERERRSTRSVDLYPVAMGYVSYRCRLSINSFMRRPRSVTLADVWEEHG